MDTKDLKEKLFFLNEIGVNYLNISSNSLQNKNSNTKNNNFMKKKEYFEDIKQQVSSCKKCPLYKTKKNYVFGNGNPDADIIFIGEAPGRDEDIKGEAFVGRAGKKLTQMIKAMGYERKDIFIANIVKCRPPGNATPGPEIIKKCFPYLQKQIAIIEPKVIVALGRVSAATLLDTNESMKNLRGKFGYYQNIPVMPTYHPAYVLRNYTVYVRKAVWNDLKKVINYIDENS